MSFWKKIFKKQDTSSNDLRPIGKPLPDEFRNWVKLSIKLMGNEAKSMEDEELHDYLIEKGIPEYEAGEIIVFLPTAFCKKLLPNAKYMPYYIDYYCSDNNEINAKIERNYKDNKRYLIIEEEVEKYWTANPKEEALVNIAIRSSEFGAINKALNNGKKIEDLQSLLTLNSVIRYE